MLKVYSKSPLIRQVPLFFHGFPSSRQAAAGHLLCGQASPPARVPGGCRGFKELKGDTGLTGTRVSPRGPCATVPTAAGMAGVCPLGWTRGDGVPAVPPSKALSPSGVGRCAGARWVCEGHGRHGSVPSSWGRQGVLTGVHTQPLATSHTLLLSHTSTQPATHARTLINSQARTVPHALTPRNTEYHTSIVSYAPGVTHVLALAPSITCTRSTTLTQYHTCTVSPPPPPRVSRLHTEYLAHVVAHTHSVSHAQSVIRARARACTQRLTLAHRVSHSPPASHRARAVTHTRALAPYHTHTRTQYLTRPALDTHTSHTPSSTLPYTQYHTPGITLTPSITLNARAVTHAHPAPRARHLARPV